MISLLLFLCMVNVAAGTPFEGCDAGSLEGCPGTQNCSVHTITQNIDHFGWEPPLGNGKHQTFKQRYFQYDKAWSTDKDGNRGPVFFYFGNEDNVELYVNHTGLMWENAHDFGALLIFAEHRYYGTSLPFNDGTKGCMSYLTTEQAMADFAYLIDNLRQQKGVQNSPFIGFGGSYGGMIAAWFRIHYPNAIDGVVAASAPIWSFTGLNPPYNDNAFYLGVTNDVKGPTIQPSCFDHLREVWGKILANGQDKDGAAVLSNSFRTCSPVRPNSDDALAIVEWAQEPWALMAMGSYPYPSTYLLHGKSFLPTWPIQTACIQLTPEFDTDAELFEALRQAVSLVYNSTYDVECYNITKQAPGAAARRSRMLATPYLDAQERQRNGEQEIQGNNPSCQGDWGYQWCTEMTQPFTQGTDQDFYYCPNGTFYKKENCSAWSLQDSAAGCQPEWGVFPRPEWARVALGGKRIKDATNIVFSNGLMDPWHGGGVLTNVSESVLSIIIPNGGHHVDLMFSDPRDEPYPYIALARNLEKAQMQKWVKQAYLKNNITTWKLKTDHKK
eukprot:m.14105 g.14105  ORF g.14105 m.14105 type:complete len:555 (+) comp4990_c0_seq1:93-1757(+)